MVLVLHGLQRVVKHEQSILEKRLPMLRTHQAEHSPLKLRPAPGWRNTGNPLMHQGAQLEFSIDVCDAGLALAHLLLAVLCCQHTVPACMILWLCTFDAKLSDAYTSVTWAACSFSCAALASPICLLRGSSQSFCL